MKNFLKKIIFIFSIVFSFNIFLSSISVADGQWVVEASSARESSQNVADSQKQEEDFSKNLKMYQSIWQAMYAITWPILIVAWQFMDNAVVYGSFIWMDTLLWKIWNMIRMFANYIIWFVLIFSIFTLFMWSKLQNFHPVKVLPQIVVASLLVNASWFLMWFLIDTANIITYSVGTLPMKVAKIEDGKKPLDDIKMPTSVIELNQSSNWNAFKVWIKDGWKILPYCESFQTWSAKANMSVNNGPCAFQYKWEFHRIEKDQIFDPISFEWKDWIWSKTFWQVKDELGWMTAVLTTLYGSLIDIGKNVSYPSGWNSAMAADVVLKLIFLIALLIPLITLAIILIVRAVMLWFYIILSPLVFLFTPLKGFWKILWEKWQLSSICCLIFLPAIVVFALSISFVFLSYLKFNSWSMKKVFNIESKWSASSIDIKLSDDPKANDKITMTYKWTEAAWTSLFGNFWTAILWIIQTMFAISFMWVIVFSALKACKITWWIAESINKFALWMAKAAPVMPVPGAWFQSLSSLKMGLDKVKQYPTSVQQRQYADSLQPALEEIQRSIAWTEKKTIKSAESTISGINTWSFSVPSFGATIDDSGGIVWTKWASSDKVADLIKDQNFIKSISSTTGKRIGELETIIKQAVSENSDITWKDLVISDRIKDLDKSDVKNKLESMFDNITIQQIEPESQKELIRKLKQIFDWNKHADELKEDVLVKDQLREVTRFLHYTIGFREERIMKFISDNIIWSWNVKNKDKRIQDIKWWIAA